MAGVSLQLYEYPTDVVRLSCAKCGRAIKKENLKPLVLKTTRSHYGSPFDGANDYVVLNDSRVIGRISAAAGTATASVVLNNHCYGLCASTVAATQRHVSKRWLISRRNGPKRTPSRNFVLP